MTHVNTNDGGPGYQSDMTHNQNKEGILLDSKLTTGVTYIYIHPGAFTRNYEL